VNELARLVLSAPPLRYVSNLSFDQERVKVHRNDCRTLTVGGAMTRYVFDAVDLTAAVLVERERQREFGFDGPVTACRYCAAVGASPS
jgi:hypothetical protein